MNAKQAPAADPRGEEAARYFQDLQSRICAAFESFEPEARFERRAWTRQPGERLQGSGITCLMRGAVFEKVGVNFSNVCGTFEPRHRASVQGAEQSDGRFIATGISLVAHMANPFVPAVHMNVRRLATTEAWFGGGSDLTPTFPFDQDTADFHAALEQACDGYRPGAYKEYKEWCDRYFYLPHRKEPRGVGGIFFDDLRSGDAAADFAFVRAVGEAFLGVYPRLVERRLRTPFTEADRERLLVKRGRYVEFNLVYDRGTKFGFQTEADPEAYLMSMPPIVKW
jgi:coproporphyrinogen III oxidase